MPNRWAQHRPSCFAMGNSKYNKSFTYGSCWSLWRSLQSSNSCCYQRNLVQDKIFHWTWKSRSCPLEISSSTFQSAPMFGHLTLWVTFNLLLVSNYGCWQILLARGYLMEQGFPYNWRAEEVHWSPAWPTQDVTRCNLNHESWNISVQMSAAGQNRLNQYRYMNNGDFLH